MTESNIRIHRILVVVCIAVGLAGLLGCGSGNTDRKMAQIAVWEDEGWTANGELTALLFDDDPGVRQRAALALARVNDTLAIDSVRMAYLDDPDPGVRATAAFVYGAGLWRKGTQDVIESLKRDNNPVVIRESLQAMARLYARDDYALIFPLLRHEDPLVREQAVLTLNLLNRRDDIDSLIRLLDDPDQRVQWSVLFTFLGAQDEKASQAALPFLRNDSVELRRLAYRVVGSSPDLRMKDTVLAALEDPNELIRASAAEALGMQIDTISILKTYPYLESETSPLVLMNLLKALAEHWRPSAEPYLRRLLQHEDPGVRVEAIKTAVRRLDGDFADIIAPAARDPEPIVRMAYCQAVENMINYIQFDQKEVIHWIDSLTFDPVPRVRAQALEAYSALNGERAWSHLNRLYNDEDYRCKQMAINLIGSFRLQAYKDSLYDLYPKIAGMWRPEIKWAILAATTNSSPSVQADAVRREILNWGINDPNRLVRWYSIAVWEKFREDRRSELGTYKTDLTVQNVNELLHPYPSNPIAHLETTRGRVSLELLQDRAPRAVRQFIEVARGGYYDNCPMNDVQPGYIVQTGDRRGNEWGLPDETVRDELQPDRVGTGDVLWLINSRDSGHGSFGMALSRLPYLDWRYSRFAKIVDGLDIARELTYSDSIKTVTIEIPGAS